MNYTQAQLDAISTIDQNLQIIACAGSGKTEVVAARVAEILSTGVAPGSVVAFTFTEKAGAELKDRIGLRVRERLGDVPGMAEMYVGTIHGYCLELLQGSVPEYFKFSVLNEVQARLLVDRAPQKTGLADVGLKRYSDSRLYLDVLGTLREGDPDMEILLNDARGRTAWSALGKYTTYLEERRYLDFTEVMVQAVAQVIDNKDLRAKLARRVKFLIVDEYQDVNPLQECLVKELHGLGVNLCVVGDDDQTIYQWRGSSVDNILTFASRYPAVKTVTIDENYRSSPGVVRSARQVIENNNPNRLPKAMTSASHQAYSRGDLLALRLPSPEEEARWIAHKAKSLLGTPFCDSPDSPPRGLAPSDIAVLLRSVRRNGDLIVRALQDEGLPVVVVGMAELFRTSEAQAAAGIFHYMAQGISEDALKDLWRDADVGVDEADLSTAVDQLTESRRFQQGQRFGIYNLQRTFMTFLETIGLREESIPGGRGEIVFYNLGKFSQVISDFEQIHFQSDPKRKYDEFSRFLTHQAPDYYPEGWQDAGYAKPDAVQVMTVHQAKGMEWPVVFVPCLQRNRFPAPKMGGKSRWHVIPRAAIPTADGYDGSIEDERRLFYVALTRSKKWLFCSWAPDTSSNRYRQPSAFLDEWTASTAVLTADPNIPGPPPLPPTPRRAVENTTLTFSELKYYFECPYQFKLRFQYGFNPPLHEALGYGKSLHDALAEVHKRSLAGERLTSSDAEELVDRHLNVPFAYPQLKDDLRRHGIAAVARYLRENEQLLDKTEHAEQVVEINLGNGVRVNGRIDLIRRIDTGETSVVDFKSTERSQAEDLSRLQLHIYTQGYKELTGKSADLVEVYNLDAGGVQREVVNPQLEAETRTKIQDAATALRTNNLPRLSSWCESCAKCDLRGICRSKP
ncbi:MAG: hypothetical protein Kow0010_20480 [Dehalococcoidia bacterium]